MPELTTDTSIDHAPSKAVSVLVVDDEADSRDALKALLELEGYVVRAAASGTAALKMARIAPPDIVILDIHMPDLDGYTVCRMMREMEELKRTRILALTALDGAPHARRCAEAGFDERMSKPLQPDTLNQLLRRTSH